MASKKPKVKQDISKIDFTIALTNLFNESPVVEHDRTVTLGLFRPSGLR